MAERFYQEMFGGPDDGGEIIGNSVARVDAPPKSDGSPVFSADHKLVNPLYVVPVMAPVASGILKNVETNIKFRITHRKMNKKLAKRTMISILCIFKTKAKFI